ncbi:MAG: hypothetical protein JSS65_12710 [Armatimonadetes bacterium]|nr:hypothetical protein [Armatimonadota bacterium]
MLNWIPALFLLLMHGAVAPDGAARDARLPSGAAAFVQSVSRPNAKGAQLAATLRMIVRYAAQADRETVGEVLGHPVLAACSPGSDEPLRTSPVVDSSRTRDGPSVV